MANYMVRKSAPKKSTKKVRYYALIDKDDLEIIGYGTSRQKALDDAYGGNLKWVWSRRASDYPDRPTKGYDFYIREVPYEVIQFMLDDGDLDIAFELLYKYDRVRQRKQSIFKR